LHTRVAIPNGTQIELLFTDITGEHFERIREGVPLLKRLPWAERVDRFVVVVDGDDLSKPGTREVATTRSRRLLLALKESGAVAGTARVAVAVTKADKLDASAIEWFAERKVGLLALARELDESVAEFMVAARPEDGTEPTGLDLLLKWICSDDRNVPGPDAALPSYERAFARVRA
jgi:hypothetical protein